MPDTPTLPGPDGTHASVNLSEVNKLALADLEAAPGAPDPVDPPAAPAATPEVPAAAPAEAAPLVPAEPAPVADTKPIELTHKGQKIVLSEEQVREFAQKGFDYTQKTQILADFKRDADAKLAHYQQREAELSAFLSDPQKVSEYADYLRQQAGLTAKSPDDIPTQADAKAIARAEAQRVKEELSREIAQAQMAAFQARQEADYRAEFTSHVAALQKSHPELNAYDLADLELALRQDVSKQLDLRIKSNPLDEIPVGEVKRLFTEAAQRRVARVQSTQVSSAKQQAVEASRALTTKGIEPPGGQAPGIVPEAPRHFKLGSKELIAQVIADLEAEPRR